MKFLLLLCFLTPSIVFAQSSRLYNKKQSSWPYSKHTGSIEFKGVMIWPDSCKTNEKRNQLVKKWYENKLGDKKVSEHINLERIEYNLNDTFFIVLPQRTGFEYGSYKYKILYTYSTTFYFNEKAMEYHLSKFYFNRSGTDWSEIMTLESLLKEKYDNLTFLREFRKKIADAVASW